MPRAARTNKLSETVTVEEEPSLTYTLTPENTPKMEKSITDFFVSSDCQIIEDSMSPAARKAIEEEMATYRKREEQAKGRKTSIPFSLTAQQRSARCFSDSDEDDEYLFGPEHETSSARREKTRPVSKPKATNRGSVTSNQQADWDIMMAQIRKDRDAALKKNVGKK